MIILTRYDPQLQLIFIIHYTDTLQFTRELRTEEDMVEGVRDRIIDAVRVRLRADVPVGVCLSGGLDSSTVAGVTAHLIKEGTKLGSDSDPTPSSMKCFTVQYDETSGLDESRKSLRSRRENSMRGIRTK